MAAFTELLTSWTMETTESWQDTTDMAERRRIQNRIAQRAYRARVKNKIRRLEVKENKGDATSTSLVPRNAETVDYVVNRSMLNDSHFIFLQRTSYAKAFTDNAARIGVSAAVLCSDDGLSPFFEATIASDSMMDLVPTSLQRTLPHHPFFDLLPFPRMRDLAMSALSMEIFDEDEFITDVGQNFYCWGREPALESSWEISPEFIKKWWFMVDKDMLKQTNFWRQNRGLPRITQEQVMR